MSFFQKSPSLAKKDDFARFYAQAHLSVFRYAMVLCAGDQPEAEDLTAEAFLRAWEKRRQFTGDPGAALGWVIAIARNAWIDRCRHQKAHPAEVLLDEDLAGDDGDIEAALANTQQVEQVLAALRQLSFRQRDIFTLRYVLGWRVNAIAGRLGLAENTVSVDLRRALQKIRVQLARPAMEDRRTV